MIDKSLIEFMKELGYRMGHRHGMGKQSNVDQPGVDKTNDK